MSKKLLYGTLCCLAVVLMLFAMAGTAFADTWDGTYAAGSWSGAGTSGDPYIVSSAAWLARIAHDVNNNVTSYSGKYFQQTADINLNGANYNWTPIGGHCSLSSGIPTGYHFDGHYDGNSHTISGIAVYNPTSGYGAYGLFGYVSGSVADPGSIANLTVTSNSTDGGSNWGVYMGTTNVSEVGGIVGYINGSVTNCGNSGMRVYVNNASASMAGGIAGAVEKPTGTDHSVYYVQKCSNTGAITGRGRVGGMVGAVYCHRDNGGHNGEVVVDLCANTGDITTVGSTTKSYTGGIVGYCAGYITNCYSRCQLATSGGHYLGGIVGILTDNVGYDCAVASMAYCYCVPTFSGGNTSYDRLLYASVDYSTNVTITDCFYTTYGSYTQPETSGWGVRHHVSDVTDSELKHSAQMTASEDNDSITSPDTFSGDYVLDHLNEAAGTDYFAQSAGSYPYLAW